MDDFIRRADAIELFRKWRDKAHEAKDQDGWWMADNLLRHTKEISSADTVSEWIPCSERHPKDGRYYVTRIDYVTNTIFTDILWYEKGIWWNGQYTGDFAVIAWMPLPKPWKGADDE